MKHLGLVGDVVKVKPGYARNYLYPQRLGIPATEDAKRQIARRAAKVREAEAIRLQEIAELVGRLEGLEFKITMKSDPNVTTSPYSLAASEKVVLDALIAK